jgi:hypothetical protein
MMISNPVNVGLGFRVYLLDCPPFGACHAKDFLGDYCCHSSRLLFLLQDRSCYTRV